MPTDVLYLVEHVARELDIACAIKRLAERRYGLRVHIASLAYGLDETCRAHRPRLIAVPYFYSSQDAFVKELLIAFPNVPVVNLAFEQLFSAANKKFKRPKDSISQRFVLHLAAGEFFRDFLLESNVPGEHIEVVGSLACALGKHPYRAAYESLRPELATRFRLDPTRPWLFFPENYAAAFFSEGELTRRRQGGFGAEDLDSYVRFTRESFDEVMHWCARSALSGEQEIIIRPRPATSAAAFREALSASLASRGVSGELPPHLHIIKDGSVREWLLASEMTMSSYSSTVVEAAAAGRPVCLATPRPFPPSVLADWNDAAPCVRSFDEFQEFLKTRGASADGRPLANWAAEHLFPTADPIAATVDLLYSVASAARALPAPPPPSARDARRIKWKQSRRRWREAWRSLLGRKEGRAAQTHEQDRFGDADVARRVAVWNRVLAESTTLPRAA